MNDEERKYFQTEKDETLKWQIIGPLSLLCAFVLAAKNPVPYDLYCIGLVGVFLSARWYFRGCFYALAFLISIGIFKHWIGELHHFWRLGLEGSIASSFFITALAFENSSLKLEALYSQLTAKREALAHSEEEIARTRGEAAQRQMAAAEKLDALQKDLEESQAEIGSFEVLNDVLRKVAARQREEKQALEEFSMQDKRRLAQSYSEIESLEKEVSQFKNTHYEIEKRELLNELNASRIEKEQSHLINEKLVRLHAKESMKAHEAMEQLHAVIEEKKRVQQQLKEVISKAEASMDALKKSAEEQEVHRSDLEQIDRLNGEKLVLEEKLHSAEIELSVLKKTSGELESLRKEREQSALQFAKAQEKIHFLSNLEPLHKQLRAQFDQKNQILHETRSALFKIDTELQTLKIEKDQRNLQWNPIPEPLCSELAQLDEDLIALQQENEELQSLVSHLTSQIPQKEGKNSLAKTLDEAFSSVKRKKKVKSKEQDLLF